MSWTAGDLANSLATEMGIEWTDSANAAQVLAFVNDAFSDVVTYHDWPWLRQQENIALIQGASSFSLASTAAAPYAIGLRSTVWKPLTIVDAADMIGVDTTVTGQPRYVWPKSFSNNVWTWGVWPTTDAAYSLLALEIVKPLTMAASTVIALPDDLIAILREMTRAYLLRSDGDYFGAKEARTNAYQKLEMMKQKSGTVKARRIGFAVSDIKVRQDSRLPVLPGNYPEY